MAVESTYNWYWFVDGLREQGRDIRLANPAKMDQYEGLKSTDDASDACWLAEHVRLGILPECYVYPKEVRPIRDALRRRQLFVRQRAQSLLSLESFWARHGLNIPGAGAIKAWTSQDVQVLGLDAFGHLQASRLLKSVQQSDALAHEIEQAVLAKVKPTQDFIRVQQVSGIGPIRGLTLLLESGAFDRFPNAGHYASYVSVRPATS
jgi:transposase